MKLFISTLLFLNISFASDLGIFCQMDNRLVDMSDFNDDLFEACIESVFFGNACFLGKPAQVVQMINDDYWNWDEMWLENGEVLKSGSLSYLAVDGPNDVNEKNIINHCFN